MNYALVALTPDGVVSRFMVRRGRWQDTDLRLPKGAVTTDTIGDASFFFRNQNQTSVGARLVLDNDNQVKIRRFPDLSGVPLKFKEVLAVSPSGQKVIVDGPFLTALQHTRGRWSVTTGPIDIYSFGARENAYVAYDLSERWLLVVSWVQKVNTILNTIYLYDVRQPTSHFVDPSAMGDFPSTGVYRIAPANDGWFVEASTEGEENVYQIRMHSGRRPTASFYAKGTLTGPVLGSDVAVYRGDIPDQERLLLGRHVVGTPPPVFDSFWNPVCFWPGLGVVWTKRTEAGLSIGKQPISLPDTSGQAQYFLLSRE